MRWFQHDSDAITDKKLMELASKYGAEGIGIYWTVVEKIAAKMGTSLTLELEEDTYQIAHAFWGRTPTDRIDAILKACEDLKLFDRGPNGRIRCMTLLKKLDKFTSNNRTFSKMKHEIERFTEFPLTGQSVVLPTDKPTNNTDLPTRKWPSAGELFDKERKKGEKAV